VRAYDPAGMALARTLLDNVAFAEDAYRCAEGAHALVLVTEWEAFRALDLGRIRDLLVSRWSIFATPIALMRFSGKAFHTPASGGPRPLRRTQATRNLPGSRSVPDLSLQPLTCRIPVQGRSSRTVPSLDVLEFGVT